VLDEFNRLPPDAIAAAFRLKKERKLVMSITCNPGYGSQPGAPIYGVPDDLLAQSVVVDMFPPTLDPAM